MSGREKSNSRLSVVLDGLFARKHLSFWIPMAAAAMMYVLFLIFGENSDKRDLIVQAPIFALLWFLGVCLVLGIQLINPACSSKAMDFFEIFVVVMVVWSAVVRIASFLFNMRGGFSRSTLAVIVTWSAVSMLHNMRK